MSKNITCLVTIDLNNKKVVLEDNKRITLKTALEKLCLARGLDVETAVFQIEDKLFNDFIDLDFEDNEDIPDLAKIRILHSSMHKVPEVNDASSSSAKVMSPNTPLREICIDGQISNLPTRRSHHEIRLPDFPEHIQRALNNREQVNVTLRHQIVEALYQHMLQQYSLYPETHLFGALTALLVSTYGHLRDGVAPGFDSWRTSLRYEFKNFRKTLASPEVLAQRSRYQQKRKLTAEGASSEAEAFSKKRLLSVRDSYFAVKPVIGEDEESVNKHKEWFIKESKKRGTVDTERIKDRMRKTFHDRILLLRHDSVDVAVENYPFFKDENLLLQDFKMLTGIDADACLLAALQDNAERLIRCLNGKNAKDLKKSFVEGLSAQASASQPGTTIILLVQCLVAHFNEKWEHLVHTVKDNEENVAAPTPHLRITVTNEINVMVDGVILCSSFDIIKGLATVFAVYWLANIQYSTQIFNTLSFFEHCFFKIGCTKPRNPVVRLLNRLSVK